MITKENKWAPMNYKDLFKTLKHTLDLSFKRDHLEKDPSFEINRVLFCDVCPSLTLDKEYKKVNRIIYNKHGSTIILDQNFRDRGFVLYTESIESLSTDFLLYYKSFREPIKEYNCPPTINTFIEILYKFDKKLACFFILGQIINAMILSRAMWAARYNSWSKQDIAKDKAWSAWNIAWGAAKAVIHDTRGSAWLNVRDTIRIAKCAIRKGVAKVAWSAARDVFRKTINAIKKTLEEDNGII